MEKFPQKWLGNYRYNDSKIQKAVGFSQTNFEVEIIYFESNQFTGKITDDQHSGGTPGVGHISGTINGNKIEFVKKMPIMSLISNVRMIPYTISNTKHRLIYYSGIIAKDLKSMSGEWKFKFGIGFNGFIPMIFFPTTGTWNMNAME